MKERLLVMNGQRIVQAEKEGAWANQKVDKAGALKPGIYNLYTAQAADKKQSHAGVIVHADSTNVYQQIGKNFVMHARSDFDKVPEIGSAKSISYNAQGKAAVAAEAPRLTRGRSM
ncbi:conjugal transfer protein TraO [Xanthomonas euvesicatoria]